MAESRITWASKREFLNVSKKLLNQGFDEGLWIHTHFDRAKNAEEFLEDEWNFEQYQVRSETRYHWFPGMWFTRASRKSNAPSSGFQVWRGSRYLGQQGFLVAFFETFSFGGGFKYFFIITPTWENDPIWLIFFRWVETTN